MLLGFCGIAGSGKDTGANFLVQHENFVKVALADPLKRICRDTFAFTDDQLWGPSDCRNAPDERYLRIPGGDKRYDPMIGRTSITVAEYLTPRFALQQLGTEWGRNCYANVWVDYAIRTAKKILGPPNEHGNPYGYNAKTGVSDESGLCVRFSGVAISDVRFQNEIDAIRRAGGKLIRLLRGAGLSGAAGEHRSEAEIREIPDSEFDVVIDNNEMTLPQFEAHVLQVVRSFSR